MVVDGTHLVLVGPMGSGKTEVGRALADHLGRAHVDLDELVVTSSGCSIPELFDVEGEAGFRQRETVALATALEGGPSVVSTGGGVVVALSNRAMLRDADATVVWLDAAVDSLVDRVGDGHGRPLLRGDVRSMLETTVEEREPFYDEVAAVRIDTSELSTTRVVEMVLTVLEQGVSS